MGLFHPDRMLSEFMHKAGSTKNVKTLFTALIINAFISSSEIRLTLRPRRSVTRLCRSRTLSWYVILGKRPRSNGAGVFEGDDERPFARRLVRMMKYLSGLRARFVPTMKVSVSVPVPVYQDGTRTALSLAAFNVPSVR